LNLDLNIGNVEC